MVLCGVVLLLAGVRRIGLGCVVLVLWLASVFLVYSIAAQGSAAASPTMTRHQLLQQGLLLSACGTPSVLEESGMPPGDYLYRTSLTVHPAHCMVSAGLLLCVITLLFQYAGGTALNSCVSHVNSVGRRALPETASGCFGITNSPAAAKIRKRQAAGTLTAARSVGSCCATVSAHTLGEAHRTACLQWWCYRYRWHNVCRTTGTPVGE